MCGYKISSKNWAVNQSNISKQIFVKINYLFCKVRIKNCGHQEQLNWCGFLVNVQNHKCVHQKKLNWWGFIVDIQDRDSLVIFI